MSAGWTVAYAAMHRDGAADFPPAGLHYVLELVRREVHREQRRPDRGALTPAETIAAFRVATRADFGPLRDEVLDDWALRTPGDLGRAVALLGRYGCLTLDDDDTPDSFAADATPFAEKRS